MNQVLILSDSHGLKKEITTITKRHHIQQVIHCGDSELTFDASELHGLHVVRGNCDIDHKFPNELKLSIFGLTFFVTHGHLHHVKQNLTTLSYRAEELGANVICFGHTHIAGAVQMNNQLFINPGSIRLPRNRDDKTYAIMEWGKKENINVRFYSLSGECISELEYDAKLTV